MKLRTLVVEDQDYQAEAIKHILEELGETKLEEFGLDGIEICLANCAAEARRLLKLAAKEKKPFDILLLDLGLPENLGENDKHDVGVDLLKSARQEDTARGIIVVSVFLDLDRYVRLAADDFIAKPYGKDELQLRTLTVWKAVREKHCRKTVNEITKASLNKLALYADKGLSYRLGSCFSRFTQSVRYETDEIRSELFKQFNLAAIDDLPSPLTRHLAAVEDSIKNARDEWKQIQFPFRIADFAPASVVVEDELKKLAEQLHPCLAVKLKMPAEHQTHILSFKDAFQDNAPMILRELLVSGLSEIDESDFSKLWIIEVEVETDDGMAEITFTDHFKPISSELAEKITNGENIPPHNEQWRAWGLSVVQHVALRGGGRLVVKPLEDGNLITYRVTLAQDV